MTRLSKETNKLLRLFPQWDNSNDWQSILNREQLSPFLCLLKLQFSHSKLVFLLRNRMPFMTAKKIFKWIKIVELFTYIKAQRKMIQLVKFLLKRVKKVNQYPSLKIKRWNHWLRVQVIFMIRLSYRVTFKFIVLK